jgi:hypothetical protein
MKPKQRRIRRRRRSKSNREDHEQHISHLIRTNGGRFCLSERRGGTGDVNPRRGACHFISRALGERPPSCLYFRMCQPPLQALRAY